MRYLIKLLVVILILVAGNIFALYPFSMNMRDLSPDNPDDVLLNSYIMQWEYEHIFSLDFKNYFNTSYFYPYKNTLAFTEHHTVTQLFFIPLYTLFRDPVFVHNIILFLLLVLAGVSMYVFIHYLTGSFFASLLGAVLFSFVPYRYTHLVHIHILHWWLIPLLFLSFYIFSRRNDLKTAVLFGTVLFLVLIDSNNIAAFISVPFGIYFIFTGLETGIFFNKRFYLLFAGVLFFVLLLALPFVLQYLELREEMFFERFLYEIRYFSPQYKNLIGVHPSNILWGRLLGENGKWECYLFPGFTFILLFVISISTLYFNRYRKYIFLFGIISLITFLLTFGPYFNGLKGNVKGPYLFLLKYFPGYYGIRVPARFVIFVYFSMSVIVSLFVADMSKRLSEKVWLKKSFGVFVIFLVFFAIYEGSHRINVKKIMNHPERDPVYSKLRELSNGAVFEYPAYRANRDAAQVYASLFHRKSIVNGYSGWNAKPLENLVDAVAKFHPFYLIRFLRDLNVRYFILRGDAIWSIYNRLSNLEGYDSGVKKIYQFNKDIIFEISDTALNEIDFYNSNVEKAVFYFPSCVKKGMKINGGIVLETDEHFTFSFRRRYPVELEFYNKEGKRRVIKSDVIAYRVYEPGSIHLLIKTPIDLSDGVYNIRYKGNIVKNDLIVSDSCSDVLSQKIEIGGERISEKLDEGEPISLEFYLTNLENYLKAAVDIDDFTTGGVIRVVLFIKGIEEENESIYYELRYPLYSDMSKGDVIHFRQKIPLFLKEGRYRLKVDLVSEKRFWFSQKGFHPIEKEFVVSSNKE